MLRYKTINVYNNAPYATLFRGFYYMLDNLLFQEATIYLKLLNNYLTNAYSQKASANIYSLYQ